MRDELFAAWLDAIEEACWAIYHERLATEAATQEAAA